MSKHQDQIDEQINVLIDTEGMPAFWEVVDRVITERRDALAPHLSKNYRQYRRVRAIYLAARALRQARGGPSPWSYAA